MHAATTTQGQWTELSFERELSLDSSSGAVIIAATDAAKDSRLAPYLKEHKNYVVFIPSKAQVRLRYSGVQGPRENVLFFLDVNSSLEILEERSKSVEGILEFVLLDDASLKTVEIYQTARDDVLDLQRIIRCGKRSTARREVLFTGGKTSGVTTTILLDDDATAGDVELFFGDGEQTHRADTGIYHQGLRSKGNIFVKGVLLDSASFNSNAVLDIVEQAQQTDTFLAEHILLLSRQAKANVIPSLEIRANDVKASHAVSVSQMDAEQVFYLMTRGLSELEAKKILVLAFMKGALDQMTSDAIKSSFGKTFEEKWR